LLESLFFRRKIGIPAKVRASWRAVRDLIYKEGPPNLTLLKQFREPIMHEMGIVQNIMEILEEQARMHHVTRIVRVGLEFGALTAVMPDAVRFAFELLSKDGPAEGATLDITIMPLKVQCLECGAEHVMDDYQLLCPACKSPSLKIIEGRDEMRIAFMEVEDSGEE
jgi:hydrogenase nickel incorporation protein HypA/HybF